MSASDHSHIATPRLRLVPVTEVEPAEVAEAIGNYDVARWLGRVPYPYSAEDAQAFITANADMAGKVWFIRAASELVGGIAIDGELGYWLARPAWNMGYATEAGEAAIDAHFADAGEGRLASNHFPDNDRSANVLLKLGFLYTGSQSVKSLSLAQTVEARAMELSRERWSARREIRIDEGALAISPLIEGDWRRLQSFGGTPEVARMMLWLTAPWPEDAVRTWIETSRFRGQYGYRLGIRTEAGLIGTVGLGADRSLSYMIDRRFWRRGLATQAARAFLSDAFQRFPGLQDIEADHFTDNPASGRVLEKLGFRKVGTGLGASKARVERAPVVLYRLTRGDLRV